MFDNAVSIAGQTQQNFAVSGTAGQSAALDVGTYDVWSDVDVYIKVATTADDVTVSTGYLIKTNNVVPVRISTAGMKIGAVAATPGTLRFHKVSA